jgi:glycosyltransferase involved in cell wall biosynthesis
MGISWFAARAVGNPLNNRPRVDVVVPVFNGRKTIAAALQSVLAQQGCLVSRIIVVDDGSTDGTASVIQGLSNPLIELVSTPNQGVSMARNIGVDHSTAEWIAFLDADDMWMPNKLQVQLATAQANDAGFVCASVSTSSGISTGKISPWVLAHGNFIATSSVMVKQSVLRQIRPAFTPGMSFAEDYLAWLKCLTLTQGYYLSIKLVEYSLSRHPRYRWAQILLCMVTLNLRYNTFLHGSGVSWSQRFKLSIAVLFGSSRSLLSIIKRFVSSYTMSQTHT